MQNRLQIFSLLSPIFTPIIDNQVYEKIPCLGKKNFRDGHFQNFYRLLNLILKKSRVIGMKKGMVFTKVQHKNSYQARSRSFLQSLEVKISE